MSFARVIFSAHAGPPARTPVSRRRLRADLSGVLRDDRAAAHHRSGARTPRRPGASPTSCSACWQQYQPDYLGWVHDAGESFRTASTRSTSPPGRSSTRSCRPISIARVERIVAAAGGVPGARGRGGGVRGRRRDRHAGRPRRPPTGSQAVIVSGDKDFYQLIGPGRRAAQPGARRAGARSRRPGSTSPTPPSGSASRPAQVVDYLALVGDSSDNVPGVKGIGEKGGRAAAGVRRPRHHPRPRGRGGRQARARGAAGARRRGAAVARAGDDSARRAGRARSRRRCASAAADTAQLAQLFTELEFRSLIPKLDGSSGHARSAAAAPSTAVPPPAAAPGRVPRRSSTIPPRSPRSCADCRAGAARRARHRDHRRSSRTTRS